MFIYFQLTNVIRLLVIIRLEPFFKQKLAHAFKYKMHVVYQDAVRIVEDFKQIEISFDSVAWFLWCAIVHAFKECITIAYFRFLLIKYDFVKIMIIFTLQSNKIKNK